MPALNTLTIMLILLGLTACNTFHTEKRQFYYDNGVKAAEGRIVNEASISMIAAMDQKREMMPWEEFMRDGTWRYWYPNGKLRAVIKYRVSSYVTCCTASLCDSSYERVVGKYQLFDEDGHLIRSGKAGSKLIHIDTSCGESRIWWSDPELPPDLDSYQAERLPKK